MQVSYIHKYIKQRSDYLLFALPEHPSYPLSLGLGTAGLTWERQVS